MAWTAMVLSIALVAAVALVLIALFRLISTVISHRTIRKAVETNPELAQELLNKLTERREPSGDDRLAIVLVAIGIAMAVAPLIAVDDPGMVRFAIGAALFPLLVGGALWLRSFAAERARRRDRAE
jgi:membrane associated rhomboid family serine protease